MREFTKKKAFRHVEIINYVPLYLVPDVKIVFTDFTHIYLLCSVNINLSPSKNQIQNWRKGKKTLLTIINPLNHSQVRCSLLIAETLEGIYSIFTFSILHTYWLTYSKVFLFWNRSAWCLLETFHRKMGVAERKMLFCRSFGTLQKWTGDR